VLGRAVYVVAAIGAFVLVGRAVSIDSASAATISGLTVSNSNFSMRLDGTSTFRELRHLPSGTTVPIRQVRTNIANTGPGELWDQVRSLTATDVAPGVKDVRAVYGTTGKGSAMRVTTHQRFVEFQLTGVSGSPGEIRMFGPVFPARLSGFNTYASSAGGRVDLLDIGSGLFMGMVAANPQTRVNVYAKSDASMIYARSPASLLATTVPYARGQRFGVFVANAAQLSQTVKDVEAAFGIPVGQVAKERSENNGNYLFLTNLSGASSQAIIDLCRQVGFRGVILAQGIWSDPFSPSAPFLLRSGAKQFVADLRAAGLTVGVHSFIHRVPANGYYAKTYPTMVSKVRTAMGGGEYVTFTYNNHLVSTMAKHYAARIKELGVQWVYFDGAETVYEQGGRLTGAFDWFLVPLVTGAVMRELRAVGVAPAIVQSSSSLIGVYHYLTRVGTADYWYRPPTTPTSIIDGIVSWAPARRQAFQTSDLGFFRVNVHSASGPRPATLDEWRYVTTASVQHDIPLGVQTSYAELMNSPIRASIISLLWDASARRGA
jgi:hypothetical protein